jgi:hypothetical protein
MNTLKKPIVLMGLLEVLCAIPCMAQITDTVMRNRECGDRDAWCKVLQTLVFSVSAKQDRRRDAKCTIHTGRPTQHHTHTNSEVLI